MKTKLLPKSLTAFSLCLVLSGRVAVAQTNLTERQQAALAAIKKLGGKVDFLRSNGKAHTLDFDQTPVTDADLMHAEAFPTINTVSLRFATNMTGTGFVHFKALTNLANLYLPGSTVTDEGLKHLTNVPTLVNLYIREVPITDAGFSHLAGLTNLRTLYIDKTKITDAGLDHLKGLKLGGLYLQNTAITDAGLEHLSGMINLKELNLTKTKVTTEGIKKLQARLPKCRIEFSNLSPFTNAPTPAQ
jgi:hypothetical protein